MQPQLYFLRCSNGLQLGLSPCARPVVRRWLPSSPAPVSCTPPVLLRAGPRRTTRMACATTTTFIAHARITACSSSQTKATHAYIGNPTLQIVCPPSLCNNRAVNRTTRRTDALRNFRQDRGVSSVGLRPLTVYGVGREIGMTSGPTKAIKAAILGKPWKVRALVFDLPPRGLTRTRRCVDCASADWFHRHDVVQPRQ